MSKYRVIWTTFCVMAAITTFWGQAASASITLPIGPGLTQQFGQFTVWSLPFLDNLPFPIGSGDQNARVYAKDSTPGAIKSVDVVVATGANGKEVVDNQDLELAGQLDNAYSTPNPGGADWFATGGGAAFKFFAPPVGTDIVGAGGTAATWDASLKSLYDFLTDASGNTIGNFVIFFNLNETRANPNAPEPISRGGVDGLLYDNDLLAWAQIQVIDAQGVLPTHTYILSSSDDPLGVKTDANEWQEGLDAGPPEPDPTVDPNTVNDPAWAIVHGVITVEAGTGRFLHYGAPDGSEGVSTTTILQNIGADNAAFALFNAELNKDVLGWPGNGYDYLQADIRLTRLSDGYEQAFIQPTGLRYIPEPTSVVVWSVLVGLVITLGWRRRPRPSA
jgi:hypothetical protein